MSKNALVIGASGLIGRNLVFELLKSPSYKKVVVLSRKDLVIKHDKFDQHLIDFEFLDNYQHLMGVDDVFCCLGSTKAKTPDLNFYRKIDFDYPLQVAKLALGKGAKQFLLISAMGANKQSNLFYNKTKGEVEEAIAQLNYPSFQVFRPALLLGSRNEFRPVETVSQYLFRVLNPFFIGSLRAYKAVHGNVVAKAMLMVANKNFRGKNIWLNNQILDIVEKETYAHS